MTFIYVIIYLSHKYAYLKSASLLFLNKPCSKLKFYQAKCYAAVFHSSKSRYVVMLRIICKISFEVYYYQKLIRFNTNTGKFWPYPKK